MTSGSLAAELDAVEAAIPRVAGATAAELAALRTDLLGRKAGRLNQVLKSLAHLSPEQRRDVGGRANRLKAALEAAIAERETALAAATAVGPRQDLTMPGRGRWAGAPHPVTAVVDEICDIFRDLGLTRVIGPEMETEEYNFTKLNISLDHPAADAQDTFYLPGGLLLRTHTSPMQARTLERFAPPIRIVVPGLAYRRDSVDASHLPVFEQIEGLVVDEGVTFVDFKAAIQYFVRRFFAAGTTVRFRPSFFPFVEPGAEVDVQCQVCRGGGCATCKRSGYLEIMGAGMVHPAVFEACGVDPERFTGYAFGMGPERIAMLRHGIPDIRLLVEPDMRFLNQFVP
ncbi:MAG TPA: phenylalanine--tRNA ligase subunit alpha [Gemmatimonadales bacterium]|nr:phenylalanine--tRNA ligase subunit alpha [Gemmatimonadales bacterium]